VTVRRFVGVLVGAALMAAACSGPPIAAEPDENRVWTPDTQPGDLALAETDEDAPAEPMVDRSGPWTATIHHELIEEGVQIDLVAPSWAAEVQLATEPTFGSAAWRPVGDLEHRTPNTGVQELFVRYRTSAGALVGDRTVAAFELLGPVLPMVGDTIQPDRIQLTRVAPDVLQIDFRVGDVVYGAAGASWVPGPDLSVDALFAVEELQLTVDGTAIGLLDVGRWAAPTGQIDADVFAMAHRVHVRVAEPMADGALALTLGDGSVVATTLADTSFSPAVHTTHLGWASTDGAKQAFHSSWSQLDEPVRVGAAIGRVIDAADDTVVQVTGQPFEPDETTELWRGDLTGGPTTVFDLGELDAAGPLRFCIDGVGCSATFVVSNAGPWQSAMATVARSLFHQRSGIELGAPHTALERPRPYHPDDGFVVTASAQTLLEDANGRGEEPGFVDLVARATDEPVDGAWGGHFDGGDWDRRIQHLWMARRLIDLVHEYPDALAGLDLNLPESGDHIPDLLDEARWTVDLYHRMQTPDGGIRGGVEAADHPTAGSTSWTEELSVHAYAPDPWSSAIYAGVVADLAVTLEPYDELLATEYGASALAAMEWAEAQVAATPIDDPDVDVQRAIAAVSLYRLTEDERWHDLFLELSELDDGPIFDPCILATSCEASWRYARLPEQLGDDRVRANARTSIVRVAEDLLTAAATTTYGWVPEGANVQLIWGLGPSIPHTVALLRAHELTGDDRFRDQAVANASYSLGANPQGRSWITGVGHGAPENVLMVDQMHAGLPIWPGTPVYGAFTTWQTPFWYVDSYLRPAGTTPDPTTWPTLHNFVDVGVFAGQSEFTVQQAHGEAIWTFGALLGTSDFSS